MVSFQTNLPRFPSMDFDDWISPFKEEVKRMTHDVDVERLLKLVQQIDRKFSSTAITTRLRNKPKKATKFGLRVKTLINWLKLLSRNIKAEEESDIYPAFGLLLQHYVNIQLVSRAKGSLSSVQDKKLADTILGYVKIVLDGEPEFILDVILSSNARHSSQKHKDSLGYWLLHSVLTDSIFYSSSLNDVDIFTKCLTIGKCLLKSDKREHGLDSSQVVQHIPTIPEFYQKKRSIKNEPHLITLLLQTTKCNKIIKMCKQRLTLDVIEEDGLVDEANLFENTMEGPKFFINTVGNEDKGWNPEEDILS